MNEPEKTDKLCLAKLAIIQRLDRFEHGARRRFSFRPPGTFRKSPSGAAAKIPLRPWRGGPLRPGPDRRRGPLLLFVDSLADPEKDVRMAAAQARLRYQGSKAASLLLRLKALLGDREPDVLLECFLGLLTCDADGTCPVRAHLEGSDVPNCEAAILALARSRLPLAFELQACRRTILPSSFATRFFWRLPCFARARPLISW